MICLIMLIIYLIGAIIAGILQFILECKQQSYKEYIDDIGVVILSAFSSWVGVIIATIELLQDWFKNLTIKNPYYKK